MPLSRTALEAQARSRFDLTCTHLLRIKDKQAQQIPLVLNWPQQYVTDRYLQPYYDAGQPLVLFILKARQDGISTLAVAWTYHKIRWVRGISAIVAAHQDTTVANLYEMARRFHDSLPRELIPPTDRLNRKELHYLPPLDSSLRAQPARYLDISRGRTPHLVELSEIASMPDPDVIMSGLLDAVPSYGPTLILMEGTAQFIDSWHYDTWKELGRGRTKHTGRRAWARAFLPWYWGPDKVEPWPGPQWDFPPEDRAEMRAIQKRFQLHDEQIMWYWAALQEKIRMHGEGLGRRIARRENPGTPEEAFMTAGECVFPDEAMDKLRVQVRHPRQGFEVVRTGTWAFELRDRDLQKDPPMLVWEDPRAGYQYALGIDVSRGVGRDASAVVVVRMPGFVQVAHWEDAHTSTKDLAYIIAAIATYYAKHGNRPICTVELNDAGIHTNVELTELAADGPFQLYIWEYLDRLAPTRITAQSKTGWTTNVSTKPILLGVANSLLLAEPMQCRIPSEALQVDMSRTQEILRGAYRGAETGGCDLTIGWLLAIITAWRKIARFALPGHETLRPGQPAVEKTDGHTVKLVTYDSGWDMRQRRHEQQLVRVGAADEDWRTQ